jgi:hypothetical protein
MNFPSILIIERQELLIEILTLIMHTGVKRCKETQFTFISWKEHPVVIEYLKRIKHAQQSILAMLDLK